MKHGLLKDIARGLYEGIGKPEFLKTRISVSMVTLMALFSIRDI
jgi:hypothetical protein